MEERGLAFAFNMLETPENFKCKVQSVKGWLETVRSNHGNILQPLQKMLTLMKSIVGNMLLLSMCYINTIKNIFITAITACVIFSIHPTFGNEGQILLDDEFMNIVLDDSFMQPLILKEFKDDDQIIALQKEYASKRYAGYRVKGRSLTQRKDHHFIETLVLVNNDGKYVAISFDIIDACMAYKQSKNKKFMEKVKSLLKTSHSAE